jgi:uncharacterized protein YeaO (DUF488 family)
MSSQVDEDNARRIAHPLADPAEPGMPGVEHETVCHHDGQITGSRRCRQVLGLDQGAVVCHQSLAVTRWYGAGLPVGRPLRCASHEDDPAKPGVRLADCPDHWRSPGTVWLAGTVVKLKRVYEGRDDGDGRRVLVDRLWPRGLRKQDAAVDIWLRDVAPSDRLRLWYGHDPERYGEFAERYRAELDDASRAAALMQLREFVAAGPVTLLTATRDLAHSQATVLAEVLAESAA